MFPTVMYALPAYGKGSSMKYEQVPRKVCSTCLRSKSAVQCVLSCVVGYENSMPETV